MSFSFLPTMMTDALTDLTPQFLHDQGIKLLMLDFDNTIVPYTTGKPTTLMACWLAGMKDSGILEMLRQFVIPQGTSITNEPQRRLCPVFRWKMSKHLLAPVSIPKVGGGV